MHSYCDNDWLPLAGCSRLCLCNVENEDGKLEHTMPLACTLWPLLVLPVWKCHVQMEGGSQVCVCVCVLVGNGGRF